MSDGGAGRISRHRFRWLLWLAFLLVAVAVLVWVVVSVVNDANPAQRPDAGATRTPGATTSATPQATATAGAPATTTSRIPNDCAAIYTRDWSADMEGLELNPAWTRGQEQSGTRDESIGVVLDETVRLTCVWGLPGGPNDVAGLTTQLAELDEAQQAGVLPAFTAAGYRCYDELGGTRCLSEGSDDGGSWGESHFVRDGVWIATRWLNVAPDGYTHDIVAALFE